MADGTATPAATALSITAPAVVVTPNAYARQAALKGASAYFPLDDSGSPFRDTLGSYELEATTGTGITYQATTGVDGVTGVEFSGSSHVVVENNTGLASALGIGDGSWAMSILFKADAADSSYSTLFAHNGLKWVGIIPTSNVVRLWSPTVAGTTDVRDEAWHHVVLNVGNDGTNGDLHHLWVDGTREAGGTAGAAWGADILRIADDGGSSRLDGRLAGFAVFPAVLTPSDIADLWQSTGLADGTATPAATAVSITVPQADPIGGLAEPAATALSVVVPLAVPDGDFGSATATPGATALSGVVPLATPSGGTGSTASPAATAISIVVPAPTIAVADVATPAAVALSGSVPAPSIQLTLNMAAELAASGYLTGLLTPPPAPTYTALTTKTVPGGISA